MVPEFGNENWNAVFRPAGTAGRNPESKSELGRPLIFIRFESLA
jgi:hypothetical protein